MPRRRKESAGPAARAARIAGSVGFWLWAKAARRPVDSTAILAAVAASLLIVVNAVYLQSGSRDARFFANPPPPQPAQPAAPMAQSRPLASAAAHSPQPAPQSEPAIVRANDPIAEFIGKASRVMAVQRVLSDYGYGQLAPTGILDKSTSVAIEKFEREHNLPATGEVSDRLMSALAVMAGHPIQ